MQKKPTTPPPGTEMPQIRVNAGDVITGGYSRVSELLGLASLLDAFGVDFNEVLRESGLPMALFDNPENLIPLREGSRLIGLCADRAGCPHFGLLMGQHTPLESLGLVADLVKSAADVRSALRLLVRYLTLHDGVGLAMLSESEQVATYSYAFSEPGVERSEVIYDHTLAFTRNVMRTLCGERWSPQEVRFTRTTPTDLQPYRDFFNVPLQFDCEQMALVFKREWLDITLATSDPARLRAFEEQAREMEARSTGDLLAQVRRVLRRQLLSGATSMANVAEELAMHRRTLDRRLKEEQVKFQTLSDEVRYELSQQLLKTNMSVVAVAESLRYANLNAFTRAFRRWSGITPRQWRASSMISAASRIRNGAN